MTFRTLVMLCLAAMAGGIMTRGASEGSLPSKRSATRHRATKDSDSGGLLGIIADAVEGLADALGADEADEADEMEMHKTSLDEADEADETEMHKTSLDEADEADETEMHKTSLDEADEGETHLASRTASSDEADELESDDVDLDDEDDEAEDLSPAERRAWSALQDFYGERVEEVLKIMDRGMAPDASEDDKEGAKEYLDKVVELVGPLADEADETEMHKTSVDEADEADEMEMHKTSVDADRDDDEDEDDEEDMTPAELRALSALQGFYGEERLEEVAGIVDRGTAPGASEDDKERAQEYLDKAAELVGGADASEAGEGDETEMHQTSVDVAPADKKAYEVVGHVVHGVGEIVDAVAPLATGLLDAVLGDDEDEA